MYACIPFLMYGLLFLLNRKYRKRDKFEKKLKKSIKVFGDKDSQFHFVDEKKSSIFSKDFLLINPNVNNWKFEIYNDCCLYVGKNCTATYHGGQKKQLPEQTLCICTINYERNFVPGGFRFDLFEVHNKASVIFHLRNRYKYVKKTCQRILNKEIIIPEKKVDNFKFFTMFKKWKCLLKT